MTRETIFLAAFAGWGLSECGLALFRRSRRGSGRRRDRGSMLLLFGTIFLAVFLALLAAQRALLPLPVGPRYRLAGALVVMGCGLLLRWVSIILLGPLFTMNVALHDDHRLVERGPYRWLRHPSDTGLLVALPGAGLGLGDLLALALLLVAPACALYYRVRVEEEALVEAFGEEYERYRSRTWALFPGL